MFKGWRINYSKYLDKKDPIDNAILDLIKQGKLKVGFVEVGHDDSDSVEDYSRKNLATNVKHTS